MTEPVDSNLLAVCGLYCGACYHFCASAPGGEHLLEVSGQTAAKFGCQGCRSNTLYIHPGCASCNIRACADSRGLVHCGQCPDNPCEMLLAFQNDGRIHHVPILDHLRDLEQIGPERWLADLAAHWRCMCGASFSWYETTCAHCGAPLDSYGPDPTGRAPQT